MKRTRSAMVITAGRLAAAAIALNHVAGAARSRPAVSPVSAAGGSLGAATVWGAISVVVPARDEARRLAPLLAAVVGAPGVCEVIVVDDESSDATSAVAARAGATVVAGRPLPAHWVGKAWALQQGLDAATGTWVVMLDADTRPSPELPRAIVARAAADGADLITVAGRFDCPSAALRWLHPAMLTTLIYRTGVPGAVRGGPVHRRMGNGQCMAARRETLVAAGGFGAVAHHTVEDVALMRTMASAGFAVEFLDASTLLTVRMYETAGAAWTGWGRSLSLPGVDPWLRRLGDLGVVALAQALPLARLVTRRADGLDALLGLVRLGTLVGTASAYRPRDFAYWSSPLADGLAVGALARGVLARRQRWRGRIY